MPREPKFDLARAIDDRRFDDERLREHLDSLSTGELRDLLGDPRRIIRFAESHDSWKQGDGRPALADDDPAVMQVIGRCAASRLRNETGLSFGSIHPRPCGWDQYPVAALLAACEWAQFQARFVALDLLEWSAGPGKGAARYVRDGGTMGNYQNPRHADFWRLDPEERGRRIATIQYGAAG